jgi:hypothetical protein
MRTVTRSRLRRVATLSPRECVELAHAQLELIAAQLRVSTRSVGDLIVAETSGSLPSPTTPIDSRAERFALAVGRAARYGVFRPRCLVRAIATNRMLERRGIHGSRIRIGVRTRDGNFLAHAWVEYGGRVIGDSDAHVASFTELTDVRLLLRE